MAKYVNGVDYTLVKIESGRYKVLDKTGTEIGTVVGRQDHWGAYGTNGKRINTGTQRSDAVAIVLEHAARKKP